MRSTAQGSFAAMLLLIPILAVPMLAIFGVPDFAPVVESPLGNPEELGKSAASDAPPFAQAVQVPDADFAPLPAANQANAAAWPSTSQTDREQLARLQNVRQAGFQANAAEHRGIQTASVETPSVPSPFSAAEEVSAAPPFPNQAGVIAPRQMMPREAAPPPMINSGFSAPAAAPVGPALTWRSAVQRLNQLEIRNFRLEPGRSAEQFVFICSYTPRDNPRVSYRFEAEADEPLKAVEKVLAQIDSWLASR